MPPRASKRKANAPATSSGGDDPWATADEQPRKRTRGSATRIHENGEDIGRKTSNHSQSWAQWQTTFNDREKTDKRQFATLFKETAEKTREDIQMLLSKSKEDLNEVGRQHAELFKEACAGMQPASKSRPKKNTPNSVQEYLLFKTGQTIFQTCRNIVNAHEQANDKTIAYRNPGTQEMRSMWTEDMSQVKRVLLHSAQYGKMIVACNIDLSANEEDRNQLLTPPRDEMKGPGQMSLDIHQKSTDRLQKGATTWGEAAIKYMEKFVGIVAISEKQTGES